VHHRERSEGDGEFALGFGIRHRRMEAAEGDAEELLDNLEAYDAMAGSERIFDEAYGNGLLGGFRRTVLIDEDVGVEKELSAHSFRRGYKGRQHQCV